MPSLKHLVLETRRIAGSGPARGTRRVRRFLRLWWAAWRSVNPYLRGTALAIVGFVALTVVRGGAPFRGMPYAVWIIVGLVAILLVAVRRGSRPVRILPFKSLVGGDSTGRADGVAGGFTELLGSEIERIAELVRQEPFMTPADVLNPAAQRGDMVRRSSARVPFKTGVATSGLSGDIKPTEVGTVTLGPLKLQVGAVLTWLERAFSGTLEGALVQAHGVWRVVATQSGMRGRTWSAQVGTHGDAGQAEGRLARELAHRIELERPGASESGADVEGFQRLVDGLDCYQRFQQEGTLQYLDEAEDHFRAALTHSPGYAAAYHNLGLVYREQRRVRKDIGLRVSRAVWDGPTLMWQKAVTLDPTMAPARVQLARAFIEQADHPAVDTKRRSDLLEQAVQQARSALTQPARTHPMEGALASYWLGVALLKQGEHQQQHAAPGPPPVAVVGEALDCFCDAERALVDERAQRLVRDGDMIAVRPLTARIAHVVSLESECWSQLARCVADDPTRSRLIAMADHRIGHAIQWAPDLTELHALRGRTLEEHGAEGGALIAYLEALQRDPQNHHVTAKDIGAFAAGTATDGETVDLATDLFTLAVHRDPDDAVAWLLLALVVPDERTARSLAGKALTLEPGREEVRRIVDEQWPPADGCVPDAPGWEDRFTLRWARAWSDAREAQQTVDETRLRGALDRIEKLRAEAGGARPEVAFAHREIALLHASLASMIPASDEQRVQWKTAVRHLRRAVRRRPPSKLEKPPLWYVELADAYAALADSQFEAGHRHDASDNYQRAVRHYDVAIDRSPKTVRPRYRTGRQGQERQAELSAEPPDLSPRARAMAGRAAVYACQGRAGDAARDCRDALKLAPLYAYPRFTLAHLYRDQRAQYDLAEQTLVRLIELLPAGEQRDRARLELAVTHRKQAETSRNDERGRLLAQARDELVKATREASLSTGLETWMHEELATVLDLLGRSDEAIVVLRAVSGMPEQPHAAQHHERIAHLLAQCERTSEVGGELIEAQRACYARMNRVRGTDEEKKLRVAQVTLTARLAMFYAEQGIRLDEARLIADGALKGASNILDPGGLAKCEDARGWVAYREGRAREAVRFLESAVEHSGGDAQEWAHLASALEARSLSRRGHQDIDRARDIWQQILERFPHSPAAEQARHHLDLLPERLHPPRPLASHGL
ncbi:hypothetical protein [Streptomyces sp. NPDC046727]|uniref:tetratricopeptide repeat protein n=1 Tax=Streptomyces sp. NPDC046727 TaxID=3155373 RepID=UPI0033DE6F84